MNIFILNTHSILNPGDTAIVLSQIRLLKKYLPDAQIAITSRTPEIDSKLYESMGIRIFPSLLPAPSVFTGLGTKIIGCLKNLLDIRKKIATIRAIKESDLICASGGGYLYSNRRLFPGPMFLQSCLHLRLAVRFGRPLLFLPQSFGPFYNRTSSRMIKRLLEYPGIVRIFARENKSYDLLHTLLQRNRDRIETCPDMVFCLKRFMPFDVNTPASSQPHPRVGITVRQWSFPDSSSRRAKKRKSLRFLNHLVGTCEKIHRRLGGSILVYPQVTGPGEFEDDEVITRIFFNLLREKIPTTHLKWLDTKNPSHPNEIIEGLLSLDLMIATRFHSALFALIANVPVIVISYQPKSRGIMRMLGLESFCFDMNQPDPERLFSQAAEIIGGSVNPMIKMTDKLNRLGDDVEKKIKDALKSLFTIS